MASPARRRRPSRRPSLRYLAGLNEGQVARSLGISLNSVKKHTLRGVSAFRSRLGEDWQEVHVALD